MYSQLVASNTHLYPDTRGGVIHVNMELSTTTRGKAKLLWNGYVYTKHIEKHGMGMMIWWHSTCRVSKHCPTSGYTELLPANPVLKPLSLNMPLKNICWF